MLPFLSISPLLFFFPSQIKLFDLTVFAIVIGQKWLSISSFMFQLNTWTWIFDLGSPFGAHILRLCDLRPSLNIMFLKYIHIVARNYIWFNYFCLERVSSFKHPINFTVNG